MNLKVSQAIIRERRIKAIFFLGALLLIFLTITKVNNMLVSFLLAFVGYYSLAPLVDLMERRGLSRVWATVTPFLVLFAVIGIAAAILTPIVATQSQSLQENLPKYLESSYSTVQKLEVETGDLLKNIYPYDLRGKIEPQLASWGQDIFRNLPDYISQSFTVLLLTPFFAFFMLLDGRDFVRKILHLVPNNVFELTMNLNYQIGSQIGGFIRARLIETVIVGLVIWVGLLIIGFPYALVLAIFAAIVNIIPYLGPFIGFLPALMIAMGGGGDSTTLVALIIIFGIAQVIDNVILVPFLVAKIVNLHPVTVVLSVLIGAQLMGVLGMIICIPVVSTLKVTSTALYKHFTDFRS